MLFSFNLELTMVSYPLSFSYHRLYFVISLSSTRDMMLQYDLTPPGAGHEQRLSGSSFLSHTSDDTMPLSCCHESILHLAEPDAKNNCVARSISSTRPVRRVEARDAQIQSLEVASLEWRYVPETVFSGNGRASFGPRVISLLRCRGHAMLCSHTIPLNRR